MDLYGFVNPLYGTRNVFLLFVCDGYDGQKIKTNIKFYLFIFYRPIIWYLVWIILFYLSKLHYNVISFNINNSQCTIY